MAEVLEILITARDEATKVLTDLGKVGQGVLAVGIGAATAAVTGLGVGLAYAVNEAMAAQEVNAQLDAVLQSTGGAAGVTKDQVIGLADSLSLVTRYEDDAILSGENMLLTFTNIGKNVFPEATEIMLDMSTALGQDLKSSAIQLGKALNDPVQGITALRRVGVNFTEEQQTMIEGLVKAGKLEEAQTFILKELKNEFGGSAKAAGETFAGQLDILKNSLSNVAEGVGMELIPILSGLLNEYIMPLLPNIMAMADFLGKFLTTLTDSGLASANMGELIASAFGPEVAAQIMPIFENITQLATTVGDFITNQIIPFVTTHKDEIIGAVTAIVGVLATLGIITTIAGIVAALANPVTIVIALVGLLGAAWAGNWGGIRDIVTNFWNNIGKPIFEQLVAWLQVNIPIAITTLTNFWNNTLLPILTTVWNFISTNVVPILSVLGNLLGVLIVGYVSNLVLAFRTYLLPVLTDVWGWIQNSLLPVLSSFFDWLGKITGGVDGIVAAISNLTTWIGNVIEELNNITLPDWLMPGSPTPFELGLRGISDAMRDISNINVPSLNTTFNSNPNSGLSGSKTVIEKHYNLSIVSNSNSEDVLSSFRLMESLS